MEETPKEDLGFEDSPVDEIVDEAPQEPVEEPETEGEPIEEVTEEVQPEQVQPEPEPEQVVEEEEIAEPDYNQFAPDIQLPSVEEAMAQLQTDENGEIPASALAKLMADREQAIMQATVQLATAEMDARSAARSHEQKLWDKAEKDFPQIAENPELRKLVHRNRAAAILDGGNMTPSQAAKELFKHINVAKENGARQAQESVRVQESAYLESSSNHADVRVSRRQELASKADSRNHVEARAAQEALLSEWVKNGNIKIN